MEDIGDIVVLSLRDRKDRRDRCDEIFKSHCITDYRYHLTDKDEKDVYGNASRDFIEMLKTFNGITIFFEDDFELAKNYETIFDIAWRDLPEDFDLLYLGGNLRSPAEKVTSNLLKLNGAWTAHALIFSEQFTKYVINNYRYPECGVFDDWLCRIATERSFYMTYPMISWQRPCYSDFQNSRVAYNLFSNEYYLQL